MISTDLETIRTRADARRAEFDALCDRLQADDTIDDAELDARIDAIAQPIIAAIDCTACAHCCRTAQVALTPRDVARLARGLDTTPTAIIADYVDRAAGKAVGEWGVMRASPCPFLKGKLCSIYAHRPESCALYPQFTPDFRWTLAHTIDGAGACPIIYNVLAAVVDATSPAFGKTDAGDVK
ncbi:MAG: YkgJ family cysteine cluster protein [Chloroflexota bacterium]|nr:YkgJ family cysteine cluster protein [Chloroflexota bacterium]